MHLRVITLATACLALAFGGWEVSHLRAGQAGAGLTEVLVAAGGEPGFISGGEVQSDDRSYRLSALSVFSNVALHVKDNYVDPERIKPKEMLVAALEEIERQVAEVLVEDLGNGKVRVRVVDQELVVTVDDVESLWEINLKLREVFRFFEQHLPPQKDIRSIEYAAINGALSTLDPHSVLLKPEAFAEMKTSTKGEFGGLGIVISVRDAKLTIISPLDGTPASRAALKAGDVISRIGDVSTVSMPIEEAVRMLRGPEGSKVVIWIERKGWPEARKFNLMRERIKIESVEGKLLSDGVGYIKIKNFQQNTGKDLEDKLDVLAKEAGGKLKGVVIDLRNNPGGLLEQAIRVSDKFLTSGDIVTTVGYGNKLREPKRARWSGTESELPVAVLVNQGSASASEIVAGALKNLDRAVVIGERTFGKGSVQVLYDFADNSALKLTIAQYLTPGGISIQNEGVVPDIGLKNVQIDEKRVRLFFEPEGHRESALEKHLDKAGQPGNGEQRPTYSLTYLKDDKQEIEEEPADDEAPREAGFEEDYPIRFAREFLLAVGGPARSKMVQDGKDFLEKRRVVEEARVVERMKALSVDWSPAPAAEAGVPPKLETTLLLTASKNGQARPNAVPNQVEAGDEVKVEATVKNVGTAPVYRLRGVLDTENPAFLGREFLYGRLAPGESKSFSVTTRIPREAASRSDLVRLKLDTDQGAVGDEQALAVVTRYVPHPQFSYAYSIDDSKRGNGDGLLDVGEGVDFVVLVSNTGPGDADDVSLRLKSAAEGDLFLERGRVTIGAIKSGETRAGRLAFNVPKQQSGRENLPLELTIYDAGTTEWLEDQFGLIAGRGTGERAATKKGGVTLKKDAAIYGGASESAPVLSMGKKGMKFASNRRSGDFVEVSLVDEASGWVKASDVSSGGKVKAPPKLSYVPLRRPPSIELSSELGSKVVDTDTVELSGTISARSLRDMYVLLNDEKVHFATGPAAPTAQEGPIPNDAAVNMPFKLELKLKEGLNKVLVVARLDEKVVTYRSLFVTRRSLPAVAERAEPAKNKPKR